MPGNRNDQSNRYRNNYEEEEQKKPRMNMKKVFVISLCVVFGIVFISGGLVYRLGHDLYSNVNYVADEEVRTLETLPEHVEEQMEEETLSADERQGVAVSKDELNSIHSNMNSIADREAISDKDVYNVLLVGVDRQDKTWNGNSDSMILVSIDKKDDRVSMVSLMRDTYVNIPGVGYRKLNHAYASGAGPLLCETITDTYNIKVDRYVAVDFWNLVDIIDIIGGVSLEISAAEAQVTNGYITDMCVNQLGLDPSEHQLPSEGGYVYCDGVQAVAYARNRSVGNSDYERTERHRYLIRQLVEEVKKMSMAQMTEKMKSILAHVTTNIPETEIWSMLSELPDMLQYKFETDRVPYDGMYDIIYVDHQDMLVPDWEPTLEKLQKFIYG